MREHPAPIPRIATTSRLDELEAVIFDMDGVVTDTASIHAASWKRLFDEYLERRSRRSGEPYEPFDIDRDYRRYIDGKPRFDGVRDFLRSRSIVLPEGDADDPPGRETVHGLGNAKDRYFLEHIAAHGVRAYPGTVELIRWLRSAGIPVAIISSSRNLAQVLEAAGVADLFDERVDGVESARLGLKGKPDPAIFLEAARRLGVDPAATAIVEDALAGVEAGEHGGFGLVIGVDRTGDAEELRRRGADIVVGDPGELLPRGIPALVPLPSRPGAPFPEPTSDPAWVIEVVGFDPLRERDVESWFSVANGRTGTRGSLEEGSEESSPATFVAGVFGTGAAGPELLPGPEWTRLDPRVGDEPLALGRGATLAHRRVLDLRKGILFRYWRQRLPSGTEVSFRSARFASLADRRLLVLRAEASADARPIRLGGGIPLPSEEGAVARVDARRHARRLTAAVHGREGGSAAFAIQTDEIDGSLERIVAVERAGRGEDVEPDRTERALGEAVATGLGALSDAHVAAWDARWDTADVVVDGDRDAQRALRFAIYHLVSSGDPESDVASIGARGLTGRGYRGHVFWDTDVFVLPFFVHTHPATARALLAYRYRTLPAARARAASFGCRGALFAWESTDTGEDVTPPEVIGPDGRPVRVLTGLQEHHVSADVAWAAWRYWQATGDDEFLARMGAEIVLETARFWASRARRGRDGRYHIARVIGPDEYHTNVRDNAFTNVMARWNLERGLEVAALLRGSDPALWATLVDRLGLSGRELRRWRAVADGLVDGFDRATGLYEQFDGYFDLEDLDPSTIGEPPFPADAVLGHRRVAQTRIVKQADVLMLVHLLPEVVPREIAAANYDYYEPRTSHGSSLDPAIEAAVAARIGRAGDALRYFRMAGAIDLGNAMANAAHGVHVAAMGGLWQAAVFGFGGLRPEGTALRVSPLLPAEWRGLAFPFLWRGTRLDVRVRPGELEVALGAPLELAVGDGPVRRLDAGLYWSRATEGGWTPLAPIGVTAR